ncbi:type II toxin-antitoxin system VapC family toxin [Nocardia cyriacigeorgica]|uniref:type II toxin-antitoxin system VapC family toxin n=1 Tax=Nocardia cyriacigeorgica TaxID=135487 RepID=UPI00245855D8|nr:type II toxin-antitoxin system VapC family toxin [Nocardia cyriacigeorgica]
MIGYLDTSAFIPLLIGEPSSRACRRFWDVADAVVSSRLLYVESAAALAQAERMGRIRKAQHAASRNLLDSLWSQIEIAEVDEPLVLSAAELAETLALRGHDAVHCAAAAQLDAPDLVAASGDQRLLGAWKSLGIATFDTNAPDE